MKISALNGFKDILPGETPQWRRVEELARDILQRFAFSEIRLPILEKTELFARSIGEVTDIVEKEMYTFVDKKITMRPEATASIVRAYVEHSLHAKRPVQRLFTIGPMFRHERPQKGRLRQFHQMSAEILGAESARVDAELMAMAALIFSGLGINVSLELNSLGCPECRPAFRSALMDFLEKSRDQLCDDCKRRIDKNPLRVLDCKNPTCHALVEEAPSIIEHLCPECDAHFSLVQESLHELDVDFSLNKFMVRGLDYYCRTTFEFLTSDLGAQAAVCAGGRYDGLVALLGGPKVPGIGFAIGLERLVLLLQQKEAEEEQMAGRIDVFVAGLGEMAGKFSYTLVHSLRKHGLSAAMDYEGRSLKSQMKQADKLNAAYVLMIGDDELEKGAALLRNMATQEQMAVELREDEIAAVMDNLVTH